MFKSRSKKMLLELWKHIDEVFSKLLEGPRMAKNPPAFLLYSANLIADKRYRMMSLAERGLYLSMLAECWSNLCVPADSATMARWLGLEPSEVRMALTERVKSFFLVVNEDLISPDLEDYRETLEIRRNKQSTGGKKGAKRKWGKSSSGNGLANDLPNGQPNGVLNQSKPIKSLPVRTVVAIDSANGTPNAEYEETEAEKYLRATGGW
jgi:uncharacterized protein YdaU (DUF1376 family)